LFVSRLASNTKAQYVMQHIKRETGLVVKCEPIVTKFDSYKSFQVCVQYKDQSQLLKPDIWPRGAIVRPFYE
jgi:hypothetical protein